MTVLEFLVFSEVFWLVAEALSLVSEVLLSFEELCESLGYHE